ncbi:hypothetical protein AGABI1DRAFT_127402 [Agaricus bisporus var. burnettii JB137-S8]|uniref:SAP domain-containing protein n=1 Tax=Agaricus bisporus var. burnettii (strain JB137-S8 / ATCC MYA-4627 / FGSC 10392) TaxID=597362 RepID=K5WW74_AGABU|nr:uncharacterized protein AGABI1DRAFT_127402 [Agaricus bisporus var. burnettii JB137-S8]EKM79716.1 hypothetical protein AGABI1DRAFT_127402 [Agaricus bisporus var. burnettii JB137-S8]
MPPAPNIPNRPLTQMNKTSLVNLAQRLALQPDGTVIALRERIRKHLAQNPDALRATQLDRLLPNRGHRGRPRGNRQPSPRPITPEPADDASGNRTDSDSEMDVESSPSWRDLGPMSKDDERPPPGGANPRGHQD